MNRRLQAFTIIEMLVIISIIVLLVAILVPALAGARKSAQKSVCLSNMTSVGQAMDTYLENSRNQTFPAGAPPTNYDLFGDTGTTLPTPRSERPLNKYLGNAVEVAQCPLDQGGAGTTTKTSWLARGSSYIYFDGPTDPNSNTFKSGVWVVEGKRMSQIKWPSLKMTVADSIIDTSTVPANNNIPVTSQWHNGIDPLQISMLFADGHAENKTRKIGTEAGHSNIDDALKSSKGYY